MALTLFRLITAALFPVVLAVALYLAEKKTRLKSASYWSKQLLAGVLFGCVAMLATEFGIPVEGATLNVRTASPLTAGLLFGGPAGIIAGILGGVHRWYATLWGAGDYSRMACTIATVLAGFMSAGCRKFLFDNKKASWFYGLAIGMTMEVLHMLLMFLTHMENISFSFEIVTKCAPPMILFNSVSVMLSLLVISLIGKERIRYWREQRRISQTFQFMLLICVVAAFCATCLFTYSLQTRIAESEADELLELNLLDVKNDILDASDESLLSVTRKISRFITDETGPDALTVLSRQHNVAGINLIDRNGIVTVSSMSDFIGYDMASGEQSAEFLCLLEGEESYVQSYQPLSFDPSISRKYAGVALPSGGFIQVGYDSEQFREKINDEVRGAAKNRHIGQNGMIIICDSDFTVVSDRNDHEGENLLYDASWHNPDIREGVRFTATIRGTDYFCMYTLSEGYYIIACLPVSEAMFSRNIAVCIIMFMEIIVFAALFAHIYHLIKRLIVDNIHKINLSLSQITSGNLNVQVNVRSNEEFASLSDDINSTVSTLKHYIAEAEARIDKELEIGRQIQLSALPSVFPPFPQRRDFDIFALMHAAKEVGGDFYDFYMPNPDSLFFIVADVSGKGIPGAMFMMTSKTLIKGLIESGKDVDEAFTLANSELCANNEAGMFVTAWMGKLNLRTGMLEYVNAGHNPPLIRRAGGEYEYLRTRPNFILAGMGGIKYRKHTLQLNPGDEIFLYTDGVTEATDADLQLYGEERLQKMLSETNNRKVDDLCRAIHDDIDRFVGEAPQFDDITMMALRLNHLRCGDSIVIRPEPDSIATISGFLEEKLEAWEISPKTANRAQIALDEMYSNIVHYSGASEARITVGLQDNALVLIFSDNGAPFDPTATRDPNITLSAEEREIGGLGIFMVRKSASAMHYEYADGRNTLTLRFNL